MFMVFITSLWCIGTMYIVVVLLWLTVIKDEGGHGYCHFFFHHFSLTAFSINSLQLLSVTVVLHSHPTLSRSLLTQSSHRILCFPRLLIHSTFWASSELVSQGRSTDELLSCESAVGRFVTSYIYK